MAVRILIGDARARLAGLPDESVHCAVTSPPYYGLRDYGHAEQIGLEPTPDAYVETMVCVFREVRRVMRADATLWLNLGDSYAAGGMGAGSGKQLTNRGTSAGGHMNKPRTAPHGLKPKDLIGIPWRVALALQADGWWLRQDIIWSKPNPMPESVTDRCTKAHEYLFLLSKSATYHYDAEAIAEDAVVVGGRVCGPKNDASRNDAGTTQTVRDDGLSRNRRSVWTIATQPFSEAHFATFPPALIEPCILAGCPVGGTVLDPFGGAGTTGLVADRLGRNAVLIELNPAYAEMARKRIEGDAPMLTTVEIAA